MESRRVILELEVILTHLLSIRRVRGYIGHMNEIETLNTDIINE